MMVVNDPPANDVEADCKKSRTFRFRVRDSAISLTWSRSLELRFPKTFREILRGLVSKLPTITYTFGFT